MSRFTDLINWYVFNGNMLCGDYRISDTESPTPIYTFLYAEITGYNSEKNVVRTEGNQVWHLINQDSYFLKRNHNSILKKYEKTKDLKDAASSSSTNNQK